MCVCVCWIQTAPRNSLQRRGSFSRSMIRRALSPVRAAQCCSVGCRLTAGSAAPVTLSHYSETLDSMLRSEILISGALTVPRKRIRHIGTVRSHRLHQTGSGSETKGNEKCALRSSHFSFYLVVEMSVGAICGTNMQQHLKNI